MPFTDQELAAEMRAQLVARVMTQDQLDALQEDSTENAVRAALGEDLGDVFDAYWAAVGAWIGAHGGQIQKITGNNVPGRVGGAPTGMAQKALYNDAFRDVQAHLGEEGFKPVKAISNQLRFVFKIVEDDDDSE